jgi:hypothetical protein
MAEGLSPLTANSIIDGFDTKWVQLHTAAPGAAGTTAIAIETDRKQVSLVASSGGTASSDADLTWVSIDGSQDATHFTVWSLASGGAFEASGTITSAAYVAGNTFTIPSGSFTLAIPVATGA